MLTYDNFFLPSDNLEDSRIFYKKLGFSEKFYFPEKGMIAFSIDNEEPAIILKDISKFPNQQPAIWLTVDDVAVEYNKMKKKGVNFLSQPYSIGTGMAVEFKDPFGNVLGITDYSKIK